MTAGISPLTAITNDIADEIVSLRKDLQYMEIFAPVNDKVIIDAGCFNGTTAIRFLNEWGQDKVKRIYSFEFDSYIYARCAENLRDYRDRVTLINKGLWDKDETIRVNHSWGGGSTLYAQGDTEASLTSIDNTVKGDHHKASSQNGDKRLPQTRRHIRDTRLHSLVSA